MDYQTIITHHQVQPKTPATKDDYTVAIASIVVNDTIKISGLRIIYLNGRFQIKWPTNTIPDSESRHIVFPMNKDFRETVEDTLIQTYTRIVESEKIKALTVEADTLKDMEVKAMKEGKTEVAQALFKAVEHLNSIIQQV